MEPSDAGWSRAAAYVDGVDGGPPRQSFSPHRHGPIDEVRIYALEHPNAWHLVTLGAADLGFELTLRLPRDDDELPLWAVDCLVSLVTYARNSGHGFAAGHQIDLRGPIKLGSKSPITAAGIVADPTLRTFQSVAFLQVVGMTADELELCRSWRSTAVVELLRKRDPMLTTVLDRQSLFDDADLRGEAEAGVAAEGSALDELHVATLKWRKPLRTLVVTLGAGASTALGPALRRKLNRAGASFVVVGDTGALRFAVAPAAAWHLDGDDLVVEVPIDEVESLARLFSGKVGSASLPLLPGLRFTVVA